MQELCMHIYLGTNCNIYKCYGVQIQDGERFLDANPGDYIVTFAVAWNQDTYLDDND
jgi:hypothetical protein